jgi:hypothetical protein
MQTNDSHKGTNTDDSERAQLMREWMDTTRRNILNEGWKPGQDEPFPDLWKEVVGYYQPEPPHVQAGVTPEEMARWAYPHAYCYLEKHDLVMYRFVDPLTLHDAVGETCLQRIGLRMLQSLRIYDCGGKSGQHKLYIKNFWTTLLTDDNGFLRSYP